MEIATVIGHVWATKKEATLEGSKLMIVRPDNGGDPYVAADIVGAGVGEQVLVVSGSTARRALGRDDCAIDTAIVGIIDTVETDREAEQLKKREAAQKAKKNNAKKTNAKEE